MVATIVHHDRNWFALVHKDKRNGNGEYSWSDKSVYKGLWNNNQLDHTDGKYGERVPNLENIF